MTLATTTRAGTGAAITNYGLDRTAVVTLDGSLTFVQAPGTVSRKCSIRHATVRTTSRAAGIRLVCRSARSPGIHLDLTCRLMTSRR